MSTTEALPVPEVTVDAATMAQLGLLKVAERALRGGVHTVRLRLPGGRDIVLLAAPHHAAFWQDHPDAFEKAALKPGTGAALTREVLGHTLLTVPDGPDWKVQRHELTGLLAQAKPWFHRPLAAATDCLAQALASGAGALLDHCVAWSMRAICDPILGNAALDRAAHDIVLALNDGFIARLEGRPQPDDLQARYAAFLRRVARERGRDSIAAQVAPTPVSDADADATLRSIVGGMLAGSLHINALALYWLLVQVAADPGLQDALAAEAAARAAFERALDAPLAFATVRESQRLRPAMAFIERQVRQACRIGPHTLQPGETVLFSPWFAQRDPQAWPDPLRFDPARFLTGARETRGANLPYGLGPRQCPGANLVNQQLTFALSALCRTGGLSLGPETRPGDLGAMFRVNLEPRGSLRLILSPRPRSAPDAPASKEEFHAF
jgi:cytochrome P450